MRRALKRQQGGAVLVPVSRTNANFRASSKTLIGNGTYNVSVPVVGNEISKLAVNNEGQVIQKKIDVQVRKIPSQNIRKDTLTRNRDLLKIKSDSYYNQLSKEELTVKLQKLHEEISDNIDEMRNQLKIYQRRRHWFLWHDHWTLANYGHMLFCLRELYDPAIHVTRQEMLDKTGKDIDAQATVKEPQLYILGQSR